jgi:hypothetical protein
MSAREIMIRTLSDVTGLSRADVARILDLSPVPIPDKEFTQEESARLLASFRRERAGILGWLAEGVAGAAARREGH